jgi:hypothetical protein
MPTLLSYTAMHNTSCLNCDEIIPESKSFCAGCGQKANTHRLTLPEILHNALHAITHADKGFFHLVKEMAVKPGIVAREYIEGKRKKYFNPFSFLVIVTGILVLVSSNFKIFGVAAKKQETIQENKIVTQPNPVKEAMLKRSAKMLDFIDNHSNLLLFVSTPFLSFFFWLFYKRKKLYYAEHLTAMAFFNSFIMIVTSLFFGPIIYFLKSPILFPIMLLFHVCYFAFAYKQLFNYVGVSGYLKTFGYSLLATVFWSIFTIVIGTSYIVFGR